MKAKKKPLVKKAVADFGVDVASRLQTVKVVGESFRSFSVFLVGFGGVVGECADWVV
jgi:hypothetical protein